MNKGFYGSTNAYPASPVSLGEVGKIRQLVVWKTRRGIKVTVKMASEVGTTPEKFKEVIKSTYDADKTLTYVQLVGKDLATFTVNASQDTDGKGESDYKLTMLDGDHLGDVLIGRYAARSADDLTILAARYEPASMEEGMAFASVDTTQIWGEVIEAGRIFMEEQHGKTNTVTVSQETFTNFSDPSLYFRTKSGTKLKVEHPTTVAAGK